MKRLILFILCFLLWCLLTWPAGAGRTVQVSVLLTGAAAALVVALAMREITTEKYWRWIHPARIFWGLVYLAVLGYSIIKANLDLAYRILHPKMPIKPGIIKVRTTLRTATAITALANSITLTPGLLTIEARPDGTLYVHWINVRTTDPEQAGRLVLARYEWFIKRIFE